MLIEIIKLLKKEKIDTYIVGSSVRDTLNKRVSNHYEIYAKENLTTLKKVLKSLKPTSVDGNLEVDSLDKKFIIIPSKKHSIDEFLQTIPINVNKIAMTYDGKFYDPFKVKKEKVVKINNLDNSDDLIKSMMISFEDDLDLDEDIINRFNDDLINSLSLVNQRSLLLDTLKFDRGLNLIKDHKNAFKLFKDIKDENFDNALGTENAFLRLYSILDDIEILKDLEFEDDFIEKASFIEVYKDYTLVNSGSFIKRLISEVGINNFKMYVEYKKLSDQAYFNIEEKAKSILEDRGVLFIRDVNLSEYELLDMGYDEQRVEKILYDLLYLIFDERIENNKLDLIKYVKKNYRYK